MDKQVFLDKLQADQHEWEMFLKRIPLEMRARANVYGKWSVKDVLAHTSVWERYMTAMLRAHERGSAVSQRELWGEFLPARELADDALNDWLVEQVKDRSFDELLGQQREVRMQLIGTLQAMSEHTLSAPEVRVAGLDWKGDKPLWQVVASMSADHVASHMSGLLAVLSARSTAE